MGETSELAMHSASLVAALLLTIAYAESHDVHRSVQGGDLEGVKRAIAADSSALNVIGPGGQSPLMHAVLGGKTEITKFLLENGADTSIAEKDGYTPMHGAGFQGRAEIAKLLIAHGLDPSDMHEDGYTPLHRACWGVSTGHTETVKVLLEAGVKAGEKSRVGRTGLEMTDNAGT